MDTAPVEPLTDQRPVVVLGLMGAGKTSVARLVAADLGRTLRDSDVDIEAAQGRTTGQVKQERGADVLHGLEAQHLLDSLADRPPTVVAAAASTVEVAECRAALGAAFVVWLDADPAVLATRFDGGAYRARYGADPLVFLREQDRVRRPLFEAVADLRLDSGVMRPRQLAAEVLQDLRRPPDPTA